MVSFLMFILKISYLWTDTQPVQRDVIFIKQSCKSNTRTPKERCIEQRSGLYLPTSGSYLSTTTFIQSHHRQTGAGDTGGNTGGHGAHSGEGVVRLNLWGMKVSRQEGTHKHTLTKRSRPNWDNCKYEMEEGKQMQFFIFTKRVLIDTWLLLCICDTKGPVCNI